MAPGSNWARAAPEALVYLSTAHIRWALRAAAAGLRIHRPGGWRRLACPGMPAAVIVVAMIQLAAGGSPRCPG